MIVIERELTEIANKLIKKGVKEFISKSDKDKIESLLINYITNKVFNVEQMKKQVRGFDLRGRRDVELQYDTQDVEKYVNDLLKTIFG
ncbi:hypothetical protein FLJC2902T_08860 [Flavobacterium limnosediminis JC2902]|uniref:Uncharacterized protein n=1 Tax=Flavobacterium limnosediminis JC2902 TaxID=1341181 RepID=V6SYI2_9FLAO|nr:hypothetical protein [Flavobacterium limnosediminis]ESU29480.1 hypothetical protein FLJC2902T_08860 [Flavobacterium limnosediminis JC2902]